MALVWAIVVAGGSGRRFGQLKQFERLVDRPVVEWSVAACRPAAAGVVLVVPPGTGFQPDYGADVVIAGGKTRAESVRNGLTAVPTEADVILVHDAARPLASAELFDAVVDAVAHEGADGAIPGLAVSDTIKEIRDVNGVMEITGTLDRSSLVAVQTPQAFAAELLRRAHAGGAEATDDAALVEALGATVRVVQGDPRNIKITTRADLRTAAQLMEG
jgi:2-C-methyl-D-erythritol 4-phosphate cytidylyltransferase